VNVNYIGHDAGDVKLLFTNPSEGENTCGIEGTLHYGVQVECGISQGNSAHVTYLVSPPGTHFAGNGGGGDNGGGGGSEGRGSDNGGS
jgi:hypothetical protein